MARLRGVCFFQDGRKEMHRERHLPYNTILVFTGILTSGIDMQAILLVLSGNLLIGSEQYEWSRKPIISMCCVLF